MDKPFTQSMVRVFKRIFSIRNIVNAFSVYLVGVTVAAAAQPEKAPVTQPPAPYHLMTGPWPADEADVVEFFSYNCSHCYQARAAVDEFLRRKPADARFVRYAISSNLPGWSLSAAAFRAAYLAGIEDVIGNQLFERMNGPEGGFADLDAVRAFFSSHPIAQPALAHLESAESVALRKRIFNLSSGIHLQKTPTFVVGGRYIAYWGSDQTPTDFANTILDLLRRSKAEPMYGCTVKAVEDNEPVKSTEVAKCN